jgi:hypothetical protein
MECVLFSPVDGVICVLSSGWNVFCPNQRMECVLSSPVDGVICVLSSGWNVFCPNQRMECVLSSLVVGVICVLSSGWNVFCPHQLLLISPVAHPASYVMGSGTIILRQSSRGVMLATRSLLIQTSRIRGAVSALPHTSSWRGA